MVEEVHPKLTPDVVVHRIGGGRVENLRLKAREELLTPAGISVLLGGTSMEAAEQMRSAFPDPVKYAILHAQSATVGSTTVEAIEAAGFAVMPDGSRKFPNHARIIHPDGKDGFNDINLGKMANVFQNYSTPENTT